MSAALRDFDVSALSEQQRKSVALTAFAVLTMGDREKAFEASVSTFIKTIDGIIDNKDVEGCYDPRVRRILELGKEIATDVLKVQGKDRDGLLVQWSAACCGLLDSAGRLDSLLDPRTAVQ